MILAGSLMLASWLISNHYPPWRASHSDLTAAAAALVLGWAVWSGTREMGGIRITAAAVFLTLVGLIPLAQWAVGQVVFFGDAWIATLYLLCAAATVAWAGELFDRDPAGLALILACTLLAGALTSCLIGLVQQLGLDLKHLELYLVRVRPGAAPTANLAQPNQFASLLGMGLASMLFLFERRHASALPSLASAVVMVVCLASTQSRTAGLLFGTGLLWHAWFGRRLSLRTPLIATMLLSMLWAVLFLAWPSILNWLLVATEITTAARLQPGPRTAIWAQLLEATWSRPWTGYGWNQVSTAQLLVSDGDGFSRLAEHSHNLILELAIWNGIPIALLLIGLSGYWLVRSMARISTIPGAYAMLLILLLLSHELVEFPLHFLYMLVPFSIAVGIVSRETQEPISIRRLAAAPMVLAFAGITAIVAIDYWNVESAFRDMRFAEKQIGRSSPDPTQLLPLSTQFTQLDALRRYSLMQPHPGMTPQELDFAKSVSQRYPFSPLLHRYALAQALNGDMTGARLTLLRMRRLFGPGPYESAKMEFAQFAEGRYPILRKLQLD